MAMEKPLLTMPEREAREEVGFWKKQLETAL